MKNRGLYAAILFLLMYSSIAGENLNTGMTFEYASFFAIINMAIVSFIMMIVPFILKIKNKGLLDYKYGRKICLWNSVIIYIINVILMIITDGIYFVGGLGAIMFYFINMWFFVNSKKIIKGENKLEDIKEDKKTEYSLSFPDEKISYSKDSWNVYGKDLKVQEIIEPDKTIENITKDTEKKKLSKREKEKILIDHLLETEQKLKIGLITVSIIAIPLLIASIYFFTQNINLTNKNNSLTKTNSRLESYIDDLETINSEKEEKIEFYDENIVFVIDGYGNYFYTYDEMEQVTQGIGEYTYWAYNKEQAISRGYKAWK